MTRAPLSRSKGQGQGHHADLLTAAFTHQAAATVTVGTYSPWEPTATLPSAGAEVGSAARGAFGATEGGDGRGHIVAAARLQLNIKITVSAAFFSAGDIALDNSDHFSSSTTKQMRDSPQLNHGRPITLDTLLAIGG